MGKIYLASASPRRKEILEKAGISFTVLPAKGEETAGMKEPDGYVMELSQHKAAEISCLRETQEEGNVIIGADTVVVFRGQILGKPKDEEDALKMLRMLQGETHQVYTGVTLLHFCGGSWQKLSFAECTDVVFYPVSEQEIRNYIRTGEPMDKAGSYAIQGKWGIHVKGIRGCYENVVGLPAARLVWEAGLAGIPLLEEDADLQIRLHT